MPTSFLGGRKGKKNSAQALETVDDYEAAADGFEEAAGKWRAGDPEKSIRFFSRAIEVYEQGLNKFPTSLDLAYNRARVLLEITTHPSFIGHLPRPLLEILQQALDSHRSALSLDEENYDTLFNTAQVLTTIAETLFPDAFRDQEALQALEEALELQSRCLAIQELKFEEHLQQQREAATQFSTESSDVQRPGIPGERKDVEMEEPASVVSGDQWVSVVEPVTKDTLIETILAQFGTLTTLCSILSSSESPSPTPSLAWIEEYSSKLIKVKLKLLLEGAEAKRVEEVLETQAIFVSEMLKAGYHLNSIDPETYKRERDAAFAVPELNRDRNSSALTADTNSLIAFNTALKDKSPSNVASSAILRWNALSTAITNMAKAAKLSNMTPTDIADTHFRRGNCSLWQYRLADPPISYMPAVKNSQQLLKNANTFYQNASKLHMSPDLKRLAEYRSIVVQTIQAGAPFEGFAQVWVTRHIPNMTEKWVRDQAEELFHEGLVPTLVSSPESDESMGWNTP